jgi:hypothetical protein
MSPSACSHICPLGVGKGALDCHSDLQKLRGGSGPDDSPARKKGDALDTIRSYGQLQMVMYTDGSIVDRVRHGGSSAVVTSGNNGNPTFLDVRHQYGPEYTTSS